MLPLDGSITRQSLSSAGSRRTGSPASSVLWTALTPPYRPSQLRLCLADRLPRPESSFAPPRLLPGTHGGQVLGCGRRPIALAYRGVGRTLPGSWGTSACMPCSSTPAAPTSHGRGRCKMLPSILRRMSATAVRRISGLCDTAYMLAVYASRILSPGYRARLASGRRPTLPVQG